jgi:hypothetical protein
MESISAGSINERGFINSLDRQGFTLVKSGCELIANLIDAFATTGIFTNKYGKTIELADDGIGMDLQGLKNMVDIFRENHANDKSMGVSGMGGSAASFRLSKYNNTKPRPIVIFTKHEKDKYLKALVPWDKIFTEGKFSGQVQIIQMDSNEIDTFVSFRKKHGLNLTGTTFEFPYSEEFNELLDEQFTKVQNPNNLKDSWGVVFGKTKTSILYYKSEHAEPIELHKYNYFGTSDYNFYNGKFETAIYHFIDNQKSRFVAEDPDFPGKFLEIVKAGNGLTTEPKHVKIDPRILQNADIINLTCGMTIDPRIFDEENPKELTASYIVNNYDSEFMTNESDNHQFCAQVSIYRNNQRITGFILDGFALGSARANGESLAKIIYHRAILEYGVVSTQNNILDFIHGIQQNKNQNQNDFPKNYERLVKYLKNWHFKEIKDYFNSLLNPVSESESDSESDSNSNIYSDLDSPKEKIINSNKTLPDYFKEQQPSTSNFIEKEKEEEQQPTTSTVIEKEKEEEQQQQNMENTSYLVNNLQILDVVTEEKNQVNESKEWLEKAAELIQYILATPTYSKTNGKEIYLQIHNLI